MNNDHLDFGLICASLHLTARNLGRATIIDEIKLAGGIMQSASGSKFVDNATRIRLKSEGGAPLDEFEILADESVGVISSVVPPKPTIVIGDDHVLFTGC